MAAIGANWQEVWVSAVWAAVWTATPATPAATVDHTARAKLLLMIRKKKRIKQRQEVKNGR